MAIITTDDIVKVMSNCFVEAKFPAFTLINLETHLEDFNILNDKEQDSDSLTYVNFKPIKINDMMNNLADVMSALGYEISFNIFNTLRLRFKANDMFYDQLTIEGWLKIVRKVVGTVNTTLRYKGVIIDG
jgi:hypothetical protein